MKAPLVVPTRIETPVSDIVPPSQAWREDSTERGCGHLYRDGPGKAWPVRRQFWTWLTRSGAAATKTQPSEISSGGVRHKPRATWKAASTLGT